MLAIILNVVSYPSLNLKYVLKCSPYVKGKKCGFGSVIKPMVHLDMDQPENAIRSEIHIKLEKLLKTLLKYDSG